MSFLTSQTNDDVSCECSEEPTRQSFKHTLETSWTNHPLELEIWEGPTDTSKAIHVHFAAAEGQPIPGALGLYVTTEESENLPQDIQLSTTIVTLCTPDHDSAEDSTPDLKLGYIEKASPNTYTKVPGVAMHLSDFEGNLLQNIIADEFGPFIFRTLLPGSGNVGLDWRKDHCDEVFQATLISNGKSGARRIDEEENFRATELNGGVSEMVTYSEEPHLWPVPASANFGMDWMESDKDRDRADDEGDSVKFRRIDGLGDHQELQNLRESGLHAENILALMILGVCGL
ncbi:hypothetical protein FB451DRAFT_1184223 [Mycena latifolia]|nr:hypothetical protein FB451DRAFT_1184223 [Mycena latifolia]